MTVTFSTRSLLVPLVVASAAATAELPDTSILSAVQSHLPSVLHPPQMASAGSTGNNGSRGLHLKPERTVVFETDEATWMSLDISPDGRTLVFDLLGDIYTLPASGGKASALITGMAFQSQPVYSPDGSKIAYLSDEDGSENLYIADADGSNAKKISSLTADSSMTDPTWSPDGEYIYVAQVPYGLGSNEIWAYHKLGGKGLQLTNAAPQGADTPWDKSPNAQGPVLSPDGRYLYYSSKTGVFEYNMTGFPWKIVRRDLQEGTVDTIVSAYGGAVRPAISPDGNSLVYATRHETETGLRIRNLTTGEDRWLAYPVTRDDQESRGTAGLLPGYSFTADGKAVIATSGGKIERIDIASGSRTSIPFSADVKLDVGPNLVNQEKDPEGPVVVRMIQKPALSPDGRSVAFSALGELYTMALEEGAKPQKISRAGEHVFHPGWSPDGRYLTYISWTADNGGHVWKIKVSGRSRPERVSRYPAYYTEPEFTPDGSEIIVLRESSQQFNYDAIDADKDLIALPAGGGDARVIMSGTGMHGIHFSDDPNRVYLYYRMTAFPMGGSPGDHKLVSVRLDGSDRRDHLRFTGKGVSYFPDPVPSIDIRISPNGRWALARSQQQLHLLAMPQVGREMQTVNLATPTVPVKTLSDTGVNYFEWSRDGQTMLWSVGSTLYTQRFADVDWQAEDSGANSARAYKTHVARIEVPRDNPQGVMVLRGATVLTMGEQGVIENADVVVKDGKFLAVGARGNVPVPAGAKVEDVSGKFITPGFVDTHGHWRNANRADVIEAPFWPFLANVAYGVTSGLDVQTMTPDIFNYQDMVDTGRMIGQRAWSTGHGVFAETDIQSKQDAIDVLIRYRKHYRTKNIKAYNTGNRSQRQYLIEAAKEVGIMPTTEGGLDLKLDLTHMLDGFAGNEHNLPIIPLYRDVVQLAAQTGIAYTPTLLVTYGGPWGENWFYTHMNPHDDQKVNRFIPHDIIDVSTKRRPWFRDEEYAFSRIADSAIKIQRAGGKVGIGSHGQFQGLGYHWEMWALGSGNAKPMEVLQAATIDGAHMIGHEQEVGSIEAGKFADLVIMNKDPRRDLKNTLDIHRVMKNGRLYNDDTLDELWPRQKKLPELWFHHQAP